MSAPNWWVTDHLSGPPIGRFFAGLSDIARIQRLIQYSCESLAIVFAYGRDTSFPLDIPIRVSRSFTRLGPLSERLLQPAPQLICLAPRSVPEVLFKFPFELVPGALDLQLVHEGLDIWEVAIVRTISLFC
jgi:hypothetical protein